MRKTYLLLLYPLNFSGRAADRRAAFVPAPGTERSCQWRQGMCGCLTPAPNRAAEPRTGVWCGRAAGVLGHGGGWALCSHNALQERFSWKYNLEITKLRQLVVTMALSVPGVYRKYQMFLRRGKFFTDTQSPRVRNWNCWLQTWWDLNWLNPEHGKDGWSCFLFNNCLCKQRNP